MLTHLITVSCTGFFQPGPDFSRSLEALGLHAECREATIWASWGATRRFRPSEWPGRSVKPIPDAVVLVVCLELCSLHVQWTAALDDLLAGSVFADGASAAIVSARNPIAPALRIDAFASAIAPAGESDMAWTIGDTGFTMRLSSYVPRILQSNVVAAIEPALDRAGIQQRDVTRWAIHPGGRAILDAVEKGLILSKNDLVASREVLRDYGNMSSATILFVLKRLSEDSQESGERTLAMSFGPGLTVETMIATSV